MPADQFDELLRGFGFGISAAATAATTSAAAAASVGGDSFGSVFQNVNDLGSDVSNDLLGIAFGFGDDHQAHLCHGVEHRRACAVNDDCLGVVVRQEADNAAVVGAVRGGVVEFVPVDFFHGPVGGFGAVGVHFCQSNPVGFAKLDVNLAFGRDRNRDNHRP